MTNRLTDEENDIQQEVQHWREWRDKPKGGCSFLFALLVLPVMAVVGMWL